MLQLLATTKFFSEGHKASGLDPRALGAVYRGRAAFRPQDAVLAGKGAGGKGSTAAREAARRQTIAERKAAEAAAARSSSNDSNGKDA
jgi:preprotein translocase subunit SecD